MNHCTCGSDTDQEDRGAEPFAATAPLTAGRDQHAVARHGPQYTARLQVTDVNEDEA